MSTSTSTSLSSPSTDDIAANFQDVQDRVQQAAAGRPVRLVAVSKTKPIPLLQAVYDAGGRTFGENYVQEVIEKAPLLPDDIQWHYIGALQSNKAKALVQAVQPVSRLTIETVGTIKLANKLNDAVDSTEPQKLKVMVQVNTSGEDSKSGVAPGPECLALVSHIRSNCPNLELTGLMTIGAPGDVSCFDVLAKCRNENNHGDDSLELSMGMSGDFEQAIAAGATSVRVGSTIFGARNYP
jgi:pyridoxal phosphate enzyme (YggS family)